MNAVSPPPSADSSDVRWAETTNAINAWRGRVLQSFAYAESEVTETLLTLSLVPERGHTIPLQHLIGQRFQDIDNAVARGGPFGVEGAQASAALTTFRQYLPLRTTLCHGAVTVTLDRRGDWIALFKIVTFRGKVAERSVRVIEQTEAADLCSDIRREQQRLGSALRSLRAKVGAVEAVTTRSKDGPTMRSSCSSQSVRAQIVE